MYIAHYMKPSLLMPDDAVIRQGEQGHTLYFVLHGKLSVYIKSRMRKQTILSIATQNMYNLVAGKQKIVDRRKLKEKENERRRKTREERKKAMDGRALVRGIGRS